MQNNQENQITSEEISQPQSESIPNAEIEYTHEQQGTEDKCLDEDPTSDDEMSFEGDDAKSLQKLRSYLQKKLKEKIAREAEKRLEEERLCEKKIETGFVTKQIFQQCIY